MTFVESISTCLKKYATFEGTASRSEFWWFCLFQFLLSCIAVVISQTLSSVVSLVLLLPVLAVTCRRLHDTDRSGWLQLLVFIPVIGWIALLIFYVQEGKANRFGGNASNELPVA